MQRRTLFGAAGCIQCVDGIHGSVEKCTRFGGRVVENNVTNSLSTNCALDWRKVVVVVLVEAVVVFIFRTSELGQ